MPACLTDGLHALSGEHKGSARRLHMSSVVVSLSLCYFLVISLGGRRRWLEETGFPASPAAEAEAPVAQAILRHMWSEARRQWDLYSRPPVLSSKKPPRIFQSGLQQGPARRRAPLLSRRRASRRGGGAGEEYARQASTSLSARSCRDGPSRFSALKVVNPLSGGGARRATSTEDRRRQPGRWVAVSEPTPWPR